METIKVDFSLHCWAKRDKQADILVGYIPTLRIYSQGRTDAELEKALTNAAEMFIVNCYGRGIFSGVLKDRGMTVFPTQNGATAKSDVGEHIAVAEASGYESSYDRDFTIQIPIELIAAQQLAGVECRQR